MHFTSYMLLQIKKTHKNETQPSKNSKNFFFTISMTVYFSLWLISWKQLNHLLLKSSPKFAANGMENFDTKVCKKLKSDCFNEEWQECSQYGILRAQSMIHTYVNRTVMLDHPGE